YIALSHSWIQGVISNILGIMNFQTIRWMISCQGKLASTSLLGFKIIHMCTLIHCYILRARNIWHEHYKGPNSNSRADTASSQSGPTDILDQGYRKKKQRTDDDDEFERQVSSQVYSFESNFTNCFLIC